MKAGMACALLHVALPTPLFYAMKLLGVACIPIMLFALGVRMLDVGYASWRIGLASAIVCPVAAWLVTRMLDGGLTLTALVLLGNVSALLFVPCDLCMGWR